MYNLKFISLENSQQKYWMADIVAIYIVLIVAEVEEKKYITWLWKKGWSKRRVLQEVITLTCCIEWKRQFETLCDFSLVTGHHGTVVEIFLYDMFDCYMRKPRDVEWDSYRMKSQTSFTYLQAGGLNFWKVKRKTI